MLFPTRNMLLARMALRATTATAAPKQQQTIMARTNAYSDFIQFTTLEYLDSQCLAETTQYTRQWEKKASVISVMQTERNIVENSEQPIEWTRIAFGIYRHITTAETEGKRVDESTVEASEWEHLTWCFYYYLICCACTRRWRVKYCVETFSSNNCFPFPISIIWAFQWILISKRKIVGRAVSNLFLEKLDIKFPRNIPTGNAIYSFLLLDTHTLHAISSFTWNWNSMPFPIWFCFLLLSFEILSEKY